MSKSFLTTAQAYRKLGLTGGSNSWIRKSELIVTGKCNEFLLTKYGNNDFVVDDDMVENSYKISFMTSLYDSWENLPSERSGVTLNESGAIFKGKDHLTYYIGNYLQNAKIVKIEVDVMLLSESMTKNTVFTVDKDFGNKSGNVVPYAIYIDYDNYHGGISTYKNVMYVSGIPEESYGSFEPYPLNEWHTITLIWNGDEKRVYGKKDGTNLSTTWAYASRPDYNVVPTALLFGSYMDNCNFNGAIRNFKLSIEK